MAWETKPVTPDSDEAATFVESYSESLQRMVDLWNEFRSKKFENQERLFGYTTADLPQEEFPELLTDDFETIRRVNEEQWQAALVRSLQKTTEFLAPPEHLPDYLDIAQWEDESSLSDEMFYTLTKYKLVLETSKGNQYVYRFDEPINNTDQISDIACPVLDYSNPSNPKIDVYIEDGMTTDSSMDPLPSPNKEDTLSFFSSIFPTVNLLGVYTGTFPVGLFEVHSDREESAHDVFNLLGLKFAELESKYHMTVYLITFSEEKYQDFESFIDNKQENTLVDVYDLLDFPTGGAEDVMKLQDNCLSYIYIIPGLEFVVYGIQEGTIDRDTARNWPYVYYRPEFTIDGVHRALEDAEELYTNLRENKNVFSTIGGDDVSPLVEDFLMTAEQAVGWPETLSAIQPHDL